MKNIGIVCEGPTDYIILKKVIDLITNETNYYVQLQPEPDLTGQYGNGWKGVWKWCCDNADIRKQLMKDITPRLDFLVVQMDGDVSRKEKSAHCSCPSNVLIRAFEILWNVILDRKIGMHVLSFFHVPTTAHPLPVTWSI